MLSVSSIDNTNTDTTRFYACTICCIHVYIGTMAAHKFLCECLTIDSTTDCKVICNVCHERVSRGGKDKQ